MAIENRNLPVGTSLWASFKKTRYLCAVEAGEEEGTLAYVLEDGSRHKSPSAAGSKVMGGGAVNGWRFWSVEGAAPAATATNANALRTGTKPASGQTEAKPERKAKKLIFRAPNQQKVAEGQVRWFCAACMKSFIADAQQPEVCPEGHRIDDPELSAPFAEPPQKESENDADRA